ncbi:MAG: PDZ domain-containing protein [Actinomycetota bacterium]|nr:PDZ domain-containing protein [Actinomycetota bacterium]
MQWFSRLTLRGRVLTIGAILTAALIAIGASVPIPYVAEGPGVTYNTLGNEQGSDVITFTGSGIPASVNEKFAAEGHLNMTTVSVTDGLPLFAALGLWARSDYSLLPREDVFPPNQTVEQVNQQNAVMFSESQSSAEIAALEYLKYPHVVYAGNVLDKSPSTGKLQPQDRITEINGRAVTNTASLRMAMAGTKAGQVVPVVVDRGGVGKSLTITLGKNPDDGSRGFLGIQPQERPFAPFTVHISLTRIGGPSAGLMFTLGVIDKLTKGDLSSGKFIAGTGEINLQRDLTKSPTVGPIGGILLKEIGARYKGATIFLVPAANCQEAVTRVPAGLQLVKVASLDDAMNALHDIAAGKTPPGC